MKKIVQIAFQLLFIMAVQTLFAQNHYVADHLGTPKSSSTSLNNPFGMAMDSRGNLWISNAGGHNIVYHNGSKFTLALGAPGTPGDKLGQGVSTRFSNPQDLLITKAGGKEYLVICDQGNNTIKLADITTITSIQVTKLTNSLNRPTGMAVDGDGNLYIADAGDFVIYKIPLTGGTISLFAGQKGTNGAVDGAATSKATFAYPTSIYVDGTDVYVTDAGKVRKISGDQVSTVKVNPDITADPDMSSLYSTADITKIGSTWIVADKCSIRYWETGASTFKTYAGASDSRDCGYVTGVAGTKAKFDGINTIYYNEKKEMLYVSDGVNHLIRSIDNSGGTSVLAVKSTELRLQPNPANGNVFISGLENSANENCTISVIDLTGKIVLSSALKTNGGLVSLNIGELREGIYVTQINFQGQIITRKLYIK